MILLVANLTVTAAMFGVIWVIQLVHYPILAGIDEGAFAKWHEFHSNRITYIVGPLMVGELALAGWLAVQRADVYGVGLLLVTIAVWVATFVLSVPIHNRLGPSSSLQRLAVEEQLSKLVLTNWVRTALYSTKLLLLIALFISASGTN